MASDAGTVCSCTAQGAHMGSTLKTLCGLMTLTANGALAPESAGAVRDIGAT